MKNPCAKIESGVNPQQRYIVLEKSVSAHCCFQATVKDRQTGESICETLSLEDAKIIANALNKVK